MSRCPPRRPGLRRLQPLGPRGWAFGTVSPRARRECRYPRGAAIDGTDSVSRRASVAVAMSGGGLVRMRCRLAVRGIRSFAPVNTAASCVAPWPPRLLPTGCLARDRHGLIDGAIWLQDGWRLDRLDAMAAPRLSSPGLAPPRKKECAGDIGSPIPREARKSLRRHPPHAPALRVRRRSPEACRSPSRPRWSRARDSQGETTWLPSVPSSRSAKAST
jgi:hypothetical protein